MTLEIGQSVQLNVEEEPRLGPGPAQTLLLLTEELTVLETAVNPETAILMRVCYALQNHVSYRYNCMNLDILM